MWESIPGRGDSNAKALRQKRSSVPCKNDNISGAGASCTSESLRGSKITEGHNKALTFYFKSNGKLLERFKKVSDRV